MVVRSVIRSICFLSLLLIFFSCIQTKTYTTDQVGLDLIKSPLYCGTYSSYVNYDDSNTALFNDSLTMVGNKVYDSIVRKRFRRIEFPKTNIISDTSTAALLSKELLSIVNYAAGNEKIRNYTISDVFRTVTQDHKNSHFLFLVPTGYTRTKGSIKKERKENRGYTTDMAIASIVGSVFATALTGGAGVFLFIPRGQKINKQGSNCHLIVYDKQKNEISFYRQQFFTYGETAPLQRKHLKNQVEYILKEYL